MASDFAAAPCDLCGKLADPSVEDCVALTCVARCHHPKEDDVYHCDCIKKYMRSFCRNMDVSRGSGYVCPKGRGKGTSAKQPCPSKVSHSQKIIIKTIKPSAVVTQDTNNGDTALGKAKRGKKGAGQAAALAAGAPKAIKGKLPTLNTVPRRTPITTSRVPEPYLPTEIVKLPPVPEKLKRDPLGRNAAAAAASAAKAAKKNAKRASARQRKLEQEQGMADGAPAAQAAPEAGSDAGESEDKEEEEWEVWDDGGQQESWLGVGGADRTVQAIDSSSGHEDDVGGLRQAWEGVDAAAAAVTSDVSGLTWGAAEFSSSPDDSPSSIAGGHLGAFSRHTPHEESAPAHTYDPTAGLGSTGQASYAPAAAAPAPTAYPAAGGYEQLNAGFSNLGTVTAAPPAAAVATYLQQQQHVSQHSSGLSAVAAALQKSASGPQVAQHAAAQGYHLQAADTHSSTQQPAWLANTTPAAPPAAPSNMAACQPAMQYAAGQYNAAQQAPATATAAGTTGMCQPAHAAAALYQAPIAAVPQQQQQQQGYGATYSTAGISSASRVHPYMHSGSNSGAHYPAATSTVPQASAASWAPQQQQYAATHAPAASTGVSLTQGYQASLPPASAACPATYPMETAAGSKQMPQQQYPGSQPVYGATGGVYGATWGAQAYVEAAATGRGAQDVEDDNLDDLLALLGVDM